MKLLLVSEGSSDRMLLSPIRWILGSKWEMERADLSWLRHQTKTLPERIRKACELYPCDLLVIHRDADSAGSAARRAEISTAAMESGLLCPWVAVVPERMTEAWFIFDEQAIRAAAGKIHGRAPLNLPNRDWDRFPDPKNLLHQALRAASERTGRDAAKLNLGVVCHQLAEDIADFSSLRALEAFRLFEQELREAAGRLDGRIPPEPS